MNFSLIDGFSSALQAMHSAKLQKRMAELRDMHYDPPLLFPADDSLLKPGGLTYGRADRNTGAGMTVTACAGCGSRETVISGGRHQCAYCRADRNGAGL